MLQGRQHVSCLTLVDQLEAGHPHRACLLACRLSLELALKDEAGANATLARFVKSNPHNPIALSEQACQQVARGDMASGLQNLQRAVQESGRELPHQVFTAMGRLAELFMQSGHMLPARGLLLLQASVNGVDAEEARTKLGRMTQSSAVPVLFKEHLTLDPAPAGVAWAPEFNAALQKALRGQWQEAIDLWSAISSIAGDAPEVWRSLAVVRGFVGDYTGAAHAYRRYADLAANEQDAIEAEATAQLLTKGASEGYVDDMVVTYDVENLAELQQRLSASDRSESVEIDTKEFDDDIQPIAIFALLDRPRLTTGDNLTRETIPVVLAEALIFAAEEGDPPRVELEVYRTQLEAARTLLEQIAGETISGPEEEADDRISAVELALSWRWRLPDDTTESLRRKFLFEQRQQVVLDIWPKLAMPLFNDQTPEAAAKDPAQQRRLLAAILVLELEDTDPAADEICDKLRRNLGLPVPEPIDATGVEIGTIRLSRLGRLDVKKLSDPQLLHAFQRTLAARHESALRRFSLELVERPSIPLGEYQLAAYQLLARFVDDVELSDALMEKARSLAQRLKRAASLREQELVSKIAGRRSART